MEIVLYVASPYGFSESSRHFYKDRLLPMLNGLQAKLGPGYTVKVLDPWAKGCQFRTLKQAMDIGRANDDELRSAHVVVAVLDQHDPGTAGEVGAAFVRSHLIVGYYGDSRLAGDAPCLAVTLQVEYYIRDSGGDIARTLDQLEEMLQERIKAKFPFAR